MSNLTVTVTETGPRTTPRRQCGDCQLCCKLLPVHDNEPWRTGKPLTKLAGERCPHQKFGKGCGVYNTRAMPNCCQVWNCRWLVNDDAAELSRPDRAHYVIDVMPDFITVNNDETGEKNNIQVVQIWIDPKHPHAHRDPALRRWLFRQAQKGNAAIIRYNSKDAIVIFAPPFDSNGEWHEIEHGMTSVKTHALEEVIAALGGEAVMVVQDDEPNRDR